MRPLHCGSTGCFCFYPLWQATFSQEHVDRALMLRVTSQVRNISLTFCHPFNFFSFAAFNGWSINPPLRLSGHSFTAGAYREDPVSLHL